MIKVFTSGAFDTLHLGHEFLLKEAKKLGDYLIVALATDSRILKEKSKLPKYNQKERIENLKKLNIADSVVQGKEGDIYQILYETNPDIIVLGYDQRIKEENLKEELEKRNFKIKVIRLPSFHPEKYKSSLLRKG